MSLMDESGITTVEIILILVVLIAAVLIFKEQIIELVENIMDKITKQAMRV
jgi:Flp pilus assembly pilin Flp